MSTLQDKVAVVTGASSGVGEAVAIGFAEAGADVIVAARRLDALEALASRIRDLGRRCLAIRTDVAQESDVTALAEATLAEFGRVDVLFNGAGIAHYSNIVDMPVEQWDETFAINSRGTFLVTKAFLPAMMKAGSGAIINVVSAERGYAGRAAYNTTKVGLVAFTQGLAEEAAPHGISVNCIRMGVIVDTALGRELHPGWDRSDWQKPEDISGVVNILAVQTPESLTGAYVNAYEWRRQMDGPIAHAATAPPAQLINPDGD